MRGAFLIVGLMACSPTADTGGDGGTNDAGVTGDFDPVPFGGSRPVSLYVPSAYTGAPLPLVILLHGYSANGGEEDLYLNMKSTAEAKSVFYMHPDGTLDASGNRYWNATDACCDFAKTGVDDSTYLSGLVAEIETRYAIDTKRVYFVGHSNGAFMSYRMACDHADIVTGIMSLAARCARQLEVQTEKPGHRPRGSRNGRHDDRLRRRVDRLDQHRRRRLSRGNDERRRLATFDAARHQPTHRSRRSTSKRHSPAPRRTSANTKRAVRAAPKSTCGRSTAPATSRASTRRSSPPSSTSCWPTRNERLREL